MATTSGGSTTRFVFDPDGRIIGEYGTSATDVKAEHLWLNPEAGEGGVFGGDDGTGGYTPLAVAQAPTGGTASVSWVHANHLGHPLLTTNASGAAAALTGYTALGFPGQIKTLADLWYNRHRDYDPTTGRYIQADPIGLAGDANPFGYAGANPLTNIDPEGLQSIGGIWENTCRVSTVLCVGGAVLGYFFQPPPPPPPPSPPPRCPVPDDDDDDCVTQWIEDTAWCDNNTRGAKNIACHRRAEDNLIGCGNGQPRKPRMPE